MNSEKVTGNCVAKCKDYLRFKFMNKVVRCKICKITVKYFTSDNDDLEFVLYSVVIFKL